ncbi:2-phosphosulfolactate phosphatase [Maribellus sp. YY47]|uniref:2-phosphosulfolactate phosphatase n=1 Tax=Maribellus sp. YY47 TaxID=2929486 RepID=UPI0020008F2A|nr:2-phosphosulfolactate phosphatase [Maribellus sp. YY47]MCK3683538.1 2-phosphosulfolactate phosphatase [Maribellus sp. YY47]
MKINILQLIEGARIAEGITVIIDVFRAFSTACFAIDKGIEKIYPLGEIATAYQMKSEHPEFLLVGERNEQKPEGFDFGNSPFQLMNATFTAKTMLHTTSSGTQGIVNATNAKEILTGAFVNADAIVRYIRTKNPAIVSLVCMGYACQRPTDEDTLCAQYIKNALEGRENNFPEMVKTIKAGNGARFFDPAKQSWSPENDFHLCTQLSRFNFVLKVEKEGELVYLRPIEV